MKQAHFTKFIFIAFPIIIFLINPASTHDLAIWIKLGQNTLNNFSLTTNENISFLQTSEEIYPSWALNIIYAFLYNLGDFNLIFFINRCVVFFIFLKIIKETKDYFVDNLSTFKLSVIFISLYTLSIGLVDRPSLIGLAVLLCIYLNFTKHKKLETKSIIKIIALTIIGINLHASTLSVLIMSSWHFIINLLSKGNKRWQDLFILPLTMVSLCINPFGVDIFKYAYLTREFSKERMITEWSSTLSFTNYIEESFLFCLIILYVIYLIYRQYKIKKLNFDHMIPFLVLGLLSVRHIVISCLFAIVFIIKQEVPNNNSFTLFAHKSFNKVISIFIVLLIILMVPFWKYHFLFLLPSNKNRIVSELYPEKEISYIIDNGIEGNIFNQIEIGGILSLKQKNKIFMDARNIIFLENDFNNYKEILNSKETALEKLDNYNIKIIVVQSKFLSLINTISTNSNWRPLNLSDEFFMAIKK